MSDQKLRKRAKEILDKIKYITIATVLPNGQPWNSPVYSAHDENYNFYWVSWTKNQHSQNIQKNPRVFLVIYDSTVPEGQGEGVYILAKATQLTDENEIAHALSHLDKRADKKIDPPKRFLGDMPRRIYKAVPQKFWMNAEGDINGEFVDKRVEVNLK